MVITYFDAWIQILMSCDVPRFKYFTKRIDSVVCALLRHFVYILFLKSYSKIKHYTIIVLLLLPSRT